MGVADEETYILLIGEHNAVKVAGPGATETAVSLARMTHPHTIVLDVAVPGRDMIACIRRLLEAAPRSQLLVRPADGAAPAGEQPLVRPDEAETADRHRYSTARVERVVYPSAAVAPVPATTQCLSSREREVLSLVARALSNRQIASRLSITEGTVKRHLRNVFTKLGATSRLDAVNRGISAAILRGEDRFPMPEGPPSGP